MHNILKVLISTFSIVILTSCWNYKKVADVNPQHFSSYSEKNEDGQNIPDDILQALPGDFRLASKLGYLTTIIYSDSYYGYKTKNGQYDKVKITKSKTAIQKASELKAKGYNVYIPLQFPYIVCFYPTDVNLIERFENEASIDLLVILNRIHNNDSTLELLQKDNERATIAISDSEKILIALDESIRSKIEEENTWRQRNQAIDQQLIELDRKIASENANLTVTNIAAAQLVSGSSNLPEASLFAQLDLSSIQTTTKHDPFEDVHNRKQEDISSKPYNTPNTKVNGYSRLDGEMVKALDKFHAAMSDPKNNLKDNGFAQSEISTLESWAKDPKNDIKIVSAARSPQQQAAVSNTHKAGSLSSKHMLGVAVDLSFNGKIYNPKSDPAAYALLRKVAMSCGLNFSLPNDPVEVNHVVLASYQDGTAPNSSEYCGKLADLLFDYDIALSAELANQATNMGDLTSELNKKNATLTKLKSEIDNKLTQVNDINRRISGLQQNFHGKQEDLQRKSNQLCSILAAKERKKQEAQRSHEREYNRNPRVPNRERQPERQQNKPDRPREVRTRELGPDRGVGRLP